MKREFFFLLTSLMLIGLLGTASMSQEAGTWTQKADMPTARYCAGSAVVDGKIYVIGGAPFYCGITAVVEEYDPAADTWTRRSDMPTARQGLRAAAVDGIIYAIGGWKGDPVACWGDMLSTVEAYDPATDAWTRKADMPTARTNPAIAVVDGIVYVIGGYGDDDEALSVVEAYDPATDTWTRKADMPMTKYYHAACVIDGRIYVSGGKTEREEPFSYVPTVEVYDPVTDTWTQASDMPRIRGSHSASVVAGKMYIIGGGDPAAVPQQVLSTVDVYNPGTDTWTTAADFPTPRVRLTTAVVDGKIYTIGGSFAPGSPALSTVEEFDPGLPVVISSVSPGGKLLGMWGQMKKVQ